MGLYKTALTIYVIIQIVVAVGIPSAMIKFIAKSKSNSERIDSLITADIITSIILGVTPSIIILSSGLIEIYFKMRGLSEIVIILLISLPFSIMNSVFLGILNGFREMKHMQLE